MSCWKWFNQVLEEAGVKVTEENRDRIDHVFHQFLDEDISYGKCSAAWSTLQYRVDDEKTKKSLVERVREAAQSKQ